MSEPADANDPTRARLFVTAALDTGGDVALDARAAHYLTTVLRLKPGAEIAVFNGRDGEFAAKLVTARKRASALEIGAQRRAQPPEPDVWLLFAPVKRARIDLIAEKATELGVTRLCPVITRRTAVARVNLARLAAIAIEAAEQCERLSVPTVDPPLPLETVLARWPAGRTLLVGDEAGGGRPLGAALADLKPGPWALLVGPEGGFAEAELDALRRFQFVTPVGLGPRVLRADTAVTAALAVVQCLIGDWGHPPRS
ncbi:MAG: 16S rRNA (uracil(1498)-N(3))-methyltransferase [Proteobacteria bacterium]|nr:16S rRNA (uracil(1498)-N(3))-methyltransferase [Pseudomonadota bacterium]